MSIQHLAEQSTNLFKVTHPRGCWLAEAGRDEGSSTAEQLMLSQGHQHSLHLPQAPTPPLQPAPENSPVGIFIWDLILHNLKTTDLAAPATDEVSSDPFKAKLCILPARGGELLTSDSLTSGKREHSLTEEAERN